MDSRRGLCLGLHVDGCLFGLQEEGLLFLLSLCNQLLGLLGGHLYPATGDPLSDYKGYADNARDRNVSRPIEPNDLMDIGPLAIAIPYCDVVVTEREWSNILNDRMIGKLYNTKITHRIEDLADFID